MVEYYKAVVEADVTIGQFQIVYSAAWKLGFDEVLQVVTPIAEAAPQWKGKVCLLQQLVARHKAFEQVPWVAKLNLDLVPGAKFASGAKRSEGEEWPHGHK